MSEWEKPCSVQGDPWTKVGTESISTVSRLAALPFGLLLNRWGKGSLTNSHGLLKQLRPLCLELH